MYKINKPGNNVEKLEKKLFKELHLRERDHLQEWISKNPEMLGEELLIIQKEFDGFNDTNERLDLLAIDKEGGLVIIENKIDDTGRNVVWQALKYTSYCSTLTNNQIIRIYQEYLDKWAQGEDAKQNLLDFLDRSEDDMLLNRKDQRIIFVANNFRKEVTSTVLWLLNHNILIQCFRATPYAMEDEIFLQVEQIIPLPETKEYMIDAMEKQREEKEKSKKVEETEKQLIRLWTLLKDKLQDNKLDYLDKRSISPTFSLGFRKFNGRYGFCVGKHAYRVELYFSFDDAKEYFDGMYKYKNEIEKAFGEDLTWERLDVKKASRIRFDMPKEVRETLQGKFGDDDFFSQLCEWYMKSMMRLYRATNKFLEKVNKGIK